MKLRLYRIRARAASHKPLPPLVCHPGAKHFSKKQVLERIPEHRTYVEPFFGGGSVFFAKPRSEKEVISDKDAPLMGFYRKLNCVKLKRCVRGIVAIGTNSENVRPRWRRHADRFLSGSSDSCDVWIGKTYGYGCSGRQGFAPKKGETHPGKVKILTNCEEYVDRLSQARIMSMDYQVAMRRYDSSDTFFYLDPPWIGLQGPKRNAVYYRGKDTTSPESVCQFLRRIKGKFLLHYDDNPRIRKACKGFRIEKVPWRSSMMGGMKEKTALLISNFKLRRSSR